MKQNDRWHKVVEAIKANREFLIVGHSIPDGDCIGSVIALGLGLVALNKRTQVVLEDEVPSMYRFLDGHQMIMGPAEVETRPACVIYLDSSDPERVGETLLPKLAGCSPAINIDHHVSNTFFGDLNVVDGEMASTAELVLELLEHLGIDLTPAIASAIYTGILMDTGCFQYSNTRPQTLRTAAYMLEKGARLDVIRTSLFESRSRVEIRLLERALSSLDFSPDGRVAWMVLAYHDLLEIGALQEHFEGLINYARFIDGVEVAMLFREIEPGVVKIGFRSKQVVDVNNVAARFGGGGHQRAAGARLEGDLYSIRDRVVGVVREVVQTCMGS